MVPPGRVVRPVLLSWNSEDRRSRCLPLPA